MCQAWQEFIRGTCLARAMPKPCFVRHEYRQEDLGAVQFVPLWQRP